MARLPALIAVVLVGVVTACSNGDGGDQENNRITRIDGPATVDDDAGADQDGAPLDPVDPLTGGQQAITPGF